MNRRQRSILIVVAIIVVWMMLAPPWNNRIRGVSYHWLWGDSYGETPNLGLLLVQWIGVLIVGAIAFVLQKGGVADTKGREPSDTKSRGRFSNERRNNIATLVISVTFIIIFFLLMLFARK